MTTGDELTDSVNRELSGSLHDNEAEAERRLDGARDRLRSGDVPAEPEAGPEPDAAGGTGDDGTGAGAAPDPYQDSVSDAG